MNVFVMQFKGWKNKNKTETHTEQSQCRTPFKELEEMKKPWQVLKKDTSDTVFCMLGFDPYDVNASGSCRFVQRYNLERF